MKLTTKQLKQIIKEEIQFLFESFEMEEKIRGMIMTTGTSAVETAMNIRSAANLLMAVEPKEGAIEQILKDTEGEVNMFIINSVEPLEEFSLFAGIRLMKESGHLKVFYFRLEENYTLGNDWPQMEPIVNKLSGKFSYSLEGLEEALYSIADYFEKEE
tara:strand:- start:8889 stop:9362 length:474 start_codon:yes stop_codon:yes gene_type:complete